MKVKVIKEFVDIHTGELRTVGSSFSCGEKRFKEIQDAGSFVEKVDEEAPKTKAAIKEN